MNTDDTDFGRQNQNQNQRPFTTEGTEDTEEEKGLPRMDADERGLESEIKPVVWRPTPDMYRTDTPEGREAYEASLRMTMAPQLGGERRPVQPVIAPGEPSETHAILG
jgi:hypothetical protein